MLTIFKRLRVPVNMTTLKIVALLYTVANSWTALRLMYHQFLNPMMEHYTRALERGKKPQWS